MPTEDEKLPLNIRIDDVENTEKLKKLLKKCYNKIEMNISQIDYNISLVFREYNELSLIHESKLGHTLKDM